MKNSFKSWKKDVLGFLPQAFLANVAVQTLALLLTQKWGGPQIYITQNAALTAFLILTFFFLALFWWAGICLISRRMRRNLVEIGPYQYIRHPLAFSFIFFLNPAIAILFRSWLMILAIIPVYFIWKKSAKKEDTILKERFPLIFSYYSKKTNRIFPNLHKISRPAFYMISGVAAFVLLFTVLNSSALSMRWIKWDKKGGEIVYDKPGPTKTPMVFSPQDIAQAAGGGNLAAQIGFQGGPDEQKPANFSEQSDSISIPKLGTNAPIVSPAGETQKQLNEALNKGVVLYPGSKLPGQNGEVFLTGHSSTYIWNKTPYGRIFALLDKLEAGDIVTIYYQNRQYDYRINSKQVLTPSQTTISETNQPTLTLMTCWPIGTSLKRLVVRGELIR